MRSKQPGVCFVHPTPGLDLIALCEIVSTMRSPQPLQRINDATDGLEAIRAKLTWRTTPNADYPAHHALPLFQIITLYPVRPLSLRQFFQHRHESLRPVSSGENSLR